MAVVARGVDGGSDINVLVDPGATGDMQVVKLAAGTTTSEALIPGDGTNGLSVDVTRVVPGTGATNLGKAEDAAHTSGDVGVMALGVQKTTAAATAADGDYSPLQVNGSGYLRTIDNLSETAISNSTTTALDNDGPVVKGSAGTLYGFQGYCDAAGFVQVHDKATAPASSNVPKIVIPIAANAPFSLDLGMRGRAFASGIAFGFSSTGPTYTDGGSHLWVDAQYS
jgi:hypothetical protein